MIRNIRASYLTCHNMYEAGQWVCNDPYLWPVFKVMSSISQFLKSKWGYNSILQAQFLKISYRKIFYCDLDVTVHLQEFKTLINASQSIQHILDIQYKHNVYLCLFNSFIKTNSFIITDILIIAFYHLINKSFGI